jgi:hypothetical protein
MKRIPSRSAILGFLGGMAFAFGGSIHAQVIPITVYNGNFEAIDATNYAQGVAEYIASDYLNYPSWQSAYNTLLNAGNVAGIGTIGPLPGWTVLTSSYDAGSEPGTVEVISTSSYWQPAPSGHQSLDLDGVTPGEIQQMVSIPEAGTVIVNFELAGNPTENPLKTLQVSVGTNSQILTFNTAGHSFPSMGWEAESLTFNVSAPGNYLLDFMSLDGATSDAGPVLADISMMITQVAPINLNIQLNGKNAVLSWNDPAAVFSLQAAPNVTGVYTNIPGATSPYTNTNTITGTQQFFRLMAN